MAGEAPTPLGHLYARELRKQKISGKEAARRGDYHYDSMRYYVADKAGRYWHGEKPVDTDLVARLALGLGVPLAVVQRAEAETRALFRGEAPHVTLNVDEDPERADVMRAMDMLDYRWRRYLAEMATRLADEVTTSERREA